MIFRNLLYPSVARDGCFFPCNSFSETRSSSTDSGLLKRSSIHWQGCQAAAQQFQSEAESCTGGASIAWIQQAGPWQWQRLCAGKGWKGMVACLIHWNNKRSWLTWFLKWWRKRTVSQCCSMHWLQWKLSIKVYVRLPPYSNPSVSYAAIAIRVDFTPLRTESVQQFSSEVFLRPWTSEIARCTWRAQIKGSRSTCIHQQHWLTFHMGFEWHCFEVRWCPVPRKRPADLHALSSSSICAQSFAGLESKPQALGKTGGNHVEHAASATTLRSTGIQNVVSIGMTNVTPRVSHSVSYFSCLTMMQRFCIFVWPHFRDKELFARDKEQCTPAVSVKHSLKCPWLKLLEADCAPEIETPFCSPACCQLQAPNWWLTHLIYFNITSLDVSSSMIYTLVGRFPWSSWSSVSAGPSESCRSTRVELELQML